jgi:type IV secretory pathway VirB6-like protein
VADENCFKKCDNTSIGCKTLYNDKGFVRGIFETFINDPLYQFVVKIALVLAITLYGFGYFFGLTNFTQGEIISRVIRYSFVYFMISPSGWDFFDQYIIRFFKIGVDSILFLIAGAFEANEASPLLNASIIGDYSDKSLLFTSSYDNLEMLFSMPIFLKILGLAFSGWMGFIYLYLVLSSVISYMVAMFSAMLFYINAQLYISLVFCFFPLVMLFMFFEKTKKTFDNWVNLLIGFAGQQLFLITTLSFFNMLINSFIKTVFSYTVCLLPILNFNIAGMPLAAIMFFKVPGTSIIGSINSMNENMPSFYGIMSFYLIGTLMSKFITGMTSIGKTIFGGMDITGGTVGGLSKYLYAGGKKLDSMMVDMGKTFGKQVVDRMGGRAMDNFTKKQSKEREDRTKKRDSHFNDVKSGTSEEMKKYKGGEEFKSDVTNIRNKLMVENDKYRDLSGKALRGDKKAEKQMKQIEGTEIKKHLRKTERL